MIAARHARRVEQRSPGQEITFGRRAGPRFRTLGRMVLAHGGGVPEAATVVVPLLVVVGFVVLERRNVRRLRRQEQAGSDPDEC